MGTGETPFSSPACDAYVAAHRHNHLPMGTLANRELRCKRRYSGVARLGIEALELKIKGQARCCAWLTDWALLNRTI